MFTIDLTNKIRYKYSSIVVQVVISMLMCTPLLGVQNNVKRRKPKFRVLPLELAEYYRVIVF